MFVDVATVIVQAGKGGDGAVSFRREIYVDKGGPDGGDGGRGGDVIFVATEQLNTLLNFRYQPRLIAENGTNGAKKKMAGKSGNNLLVKVPVGTVVKRDGEIIADLIHPGQESVVACGGDGGFGNAHFKSSVRQTPRIAEVGELGDTFEAKLELKLLADVGLVGFPNAGKSTFLSVVTNATPEIADYAFTTLTPNLGVAKVDDGEILIADIPGLIEGASDGKGLGDAFLRHVERTAVLLHLIDAFSEDVAKSYKTIRNELKKYDVKLSNRPEIIALTKTDGLDDEIIDMQKNALIKVAPKNTKIFAISSTAHSGLTDVLRELRLRVVKVRQSEYVKSQELADENPDTVITLNNDTLNNYWYVEYDEQKNIYKVYGEKIEKFARRTNYDLYDSVNRLRDIMHKFGIDRELSRQGADSSATIKIGDSSEFNLTEQ